MATEIAQAYVQILPSMRGVQQNLTNEMNGAAGTAGVSSGRTFGSRFGTALAGAGKFAARGAAAIGSAVVGASAVATASITKIGKEAFNQYSRYEQLIGGVDTLFKDSSKRVQKYAAEAYKTAGLSANDYMQTVTSFSASLLQSVGNDTKKAADYADMALRDMSDNANKMGSSMESIQNAYQGFAKSNWTMLDNLKLGYGGSAREVARLLNDSKLLNKQINLNDTQALNANIQAAGGYAMVVKAIHKVQSEMGITGTTAKEAATTIEGSVASMKAAWTNLSTGIASDNANVDKLIKQFVKSVETAGNNILPRAKKIASGIGDLIQGLSTTLLPKIIKGIPNALKEALPAVTNVTNTIIKAITDTAPQLVGVLPAFADAGFGLIESLMQGMIDNSDVFIGALATLATKAMDEAPEFVGLGLELLTALLNGLANNIPVIITKIPALIQGIVSAIAANMPALMMAGISIITGIANALVQAMPILIESLPTMISQICTSISQLLPQGIPMIIEASVSLLMAILDAIPMLLEALIPMIPVIVDTICTSLLNPDTIALLVTSAFKLLFQIGVAIGKVTPKLVEYMFTMIATLVDVVLDSVKSFFDAGLKLGDQIKEGLSGVVSDIKEIGSDIISGLWDGINSKLDWLKEKAGNIKDAVVGKVTSIFKIGSPSKVMRELGVFIPQGFAQGIERGSKYVDKSMDTLGIKRSGNGNLRVSASTPAAYRKNDNYNFNVPVYIGDGKVDTVVGKANARNAYRFA